MATVRQNKDSASSNSVVPNVSISMMKMISSLRWLTLLSLLISTARADFPAVPIIDVGVWMSGEASNQTSPSQQKVVDEILEACRTVGFFTITNHGVDQTIIQDAWSASADFFNLSEEEKLRHKASNDAEYPYGYEQKEQLSKGKALDGVASIADDGTPIEESKETFAIGPDSIASGMPLRRWMDTPTVPRFQSALETYYENMEALSLRLLELFALALGQPVDYFRDKMDRHMSALRLIHYYPSEHAEQSSWVIRAGAHTDYGALTILNAGQPGLQVLRYDAQNRSRTEWYPVPTVPGALIINLGDLMQRWTNDEWVSTLHRVVMPTSSKATSATPERRYSMAYFVNINGDTMIEALTTGSDSGANYPPILARDHLMAKHLASMGVVSDHDEL